jgi:cobalamin biosynthesis protein CobD/CbiB
MASLAMTKIMVTAANHSRRGARAPSRLVRSTAKTPSRNSNVPTAIAAGMLAYASAEP